MRQKRPLQALVSAWLLGMSELAILSSTGIARQGCGGKCCHRSRKVIDLTQAQFYLSKGVGITGTARILGVAPNALRDRLKEAPQS